MDIIREEVLKIEKYRENYKHSVYKNPFSGKEKLEEVLEVLIDVARRFCLDVEKTYAYAYGMSIFGYYFFPNNILIQYHYDDYGFKIGVPKNITYVLKT